jgi:hypothetical protein
VLQPMWSPRGPTTLCTAASTEVFCEEGVTRGLVGSPALGLKRHDVTKRVEVRSGGGTDTRALTPAAGRHKCEP